MSVTRSMYLGIWGERCGSCVGRLVGVRGWWCERQRDENLYVDSCLLYSFSRTKMPYISFSL